MNKLIFSTLKTFFLGAIILGILLFLPACTLNYWQAWGFIVVFMTSVNIIGVYLSLKDPKLLERRKNVGPKAEEKMVQKIIMAFAVIINIVMLIFCAFDYRFGWSPVSAYISIAGDALIAFGLLINLFVFKENSYGASNIQIFEDQKVISTGLYALVRNPMYMGVLIMLIGVPLSLDSWWGLSFIVFAIIPGLILRILDEENTLKEELPGYKEYMQKVKYRLLPYIW